MVITHVGLKPYKIDNMKFIKGKYLSTIIWNIIKFEHHHQYHTQVKKNSTQILLMKFKGRNARFTFKVKTLMFTQLNSWIFSVKVTTSFPLIPWVRPVSPRLMTSQFKDIVTDTQKMKTINCTSYGVWVQNFVWNFKGALWKFTQNFEPIHRKICILRGVKKFDD